MTIVDVNTGIPPLKSVDGATFLVNKPKGWTSFDVVKKIRYALKKVYSRKKYKVGHAGTLDPLAEGLLIVCSGKHTKQIQSFQDLEKEYEGTIKLGATTPSSDAEFPEENLKDISHLTNELVRRELLAFKGTIKQRPPVFSAIKKSGKRLYEYARSGEKVDVPERTVQISGIEITHLDLPYVSFRMQCSKGTYVRTLASDLGKVLGVGGYLYALKRTKIGAYSVSDAYNVQELFDSLLNQTEMS